MKLLETKKTIREAYNIETRYAFETFKQFGLIPDNIQVDVTLEFMRSWSFIDDEANRFSDVGLYHFKVETYPSGYNGSKKQVVVDEYAHKLYHTIDKAELFLKLVNFDMFEFIDNDPKKTKSTLENYMDLIAVKRNINEDEDLYTYKVTYSIEDILDVI